MSESSAVFAGATHMDVIVLISHANANYANL